MRYLKGGAARALRVLRAEAGAAAPDTPVFGGLSAASLGRRFTAAAAIAERGAVATGPMRSACLWSGAAAGSASRWA